MSWLFRPPTREGYRSDVKPFKYFPGTPVGIAVLKVNGTYTEYMSVLASDVEAATEVYMGGHDNVITDQTIHDALTAAGYTLTVIA